MNVRFLFLVYFIVMSEIFYYLIITLISVSAAFFSGLLGLGGGIVLIPSYLYLFPVLGFDIFSVSLITGITAIQTTSGSFFAFLQHRQAGLIDTKAVYGLARIAVPAAILGTAISKFLSGKQLLLIYLLILTLAFVGTLFPKSEECRENCFYKSEKPLTTNFIVFITTMISASLGFGGAVYFILILNYFYKMPVKTVVGTVTYLVLITTSVTLIGKILLGMTPFNLMPFIISGAAVGAKIGTIVSNKLSPSVLKIIFFLVVFVIWVRILITVLQY